MFGGCDQDQTPKNDLFFIQPDCENNKEIFTHSGNYINDKHDSLYLKVTYMTPSGKGPIARFGHSACNFKNKYMCIFGGRNDSLFQEYETPILNDIHLYDFSKFHSLNSFQK
jgi:hypothetical protein